MSLRKRQEIQEVLRHRKLIAAPLWAAALLLLTVSAATAQAANGAQPQAQRAGSQPNPLQPRTQRAGPELIAQAQRAGPGPIAQAQRAGSDPNPLQPRTQRAGSEPPAATPNGSVWPAKWGEHTRAKVQPVAISDAGLWAEYEGEQAEKVSFKSPIGPFGATAWRLRDATSALSWYYFTRPANCTPVRNAQTSCTTPGLAAMAINNYVLLFEGWRPLARELAELEKTLPGMRSGGGLPNLPGFLPEKNRVRNSERYIVGVESLNRFEPRIPPTLVGFEDGAEAVLAVYKTSAGDLPVTLLAYPTPQLARAKQSAFESQQGWSVKRSGTLIAVIPQQVDSAAAASVLGGIQWDMTFMWNQATKAPPMPDVAGMLIAIFELTGLLLVICIGGGILVAGLYYFGRARERASGLGEGTITLLKINEHRAGR